MEEARMYVVEALVAQGLICPERYWSMLAQTPVNRVIENLSPWVFFPDPKRSAKYCTEAVGHPVLPFAQAAGEDMVACFVAKQSSSPAVIVINPWSADMSEVIQAELGDFDAWLEYAGQVSRDVQAREQDQ